MAAEHSTSFLNAKLVQEWRAARESYRAGPVILARVMDLGSKLADALETLMATRPSTAITDDERLLDAERRAFMAACRRMTRSDGKRIFHVGPDYTEPDQDEEEAWAAYKALRTKLPDA